MRVTEYYQVANTSQVMVYKRESNCELQYGDNDGGAGLDGVNDADDVAPVATDQTRTSDHYTNESGTVHHCRTQDGPPDSTQPVTRLAIDERAANGNL